MSSDRCEEDIPFLERSAEELGWIESNYCLLIVGIAGVDFVEELVRRFPKLNVIATDRETRLIESARENNLHDNVTYCVADIEKRETLKYWFGTARKILSYHNLERVIDKKTAFQNFYHLLVPGGTMAVRCTLQNPVFSWSKEVSFRWRQFIGGSGIKSPSSELREDSSFQSMLRSIGFEILYFRGTDEFCKYRSEAECKRFLLSCCLKLFHSLPDRMKSGFIDDMFHRFRKYSTRNEQGHVLVQYRILEMRLKKPKRL